MNDYKNHFKKMNHNKVGKSAPPAKHIVRRKTSLHYRDGSAKKMSRVHAIGLTSLFGMCVAVYGMLYPETLSEFPARLRIGFFSEGMAAETATPAEDPALKVEKSAATETSAAAVADSAPEKAIGEKQNHVEQLLQKEKELAAREKHVVELEEKLQQQKVELEEKIKVLEQARRDIASRLETRVAQDQENIDKLVGVYSNMKPQSAALVIAKLDEELAIAVLRKMKKQDAGAIMNYMDPQKTKVLSEKYSGY